MFKLFVPVTRVEELSDPARPGQVRQRGACGANSRAGLRFRGPGQFAGDGCLAGQQESDRDRSSRPSQRTAG